MKVFVIDLFEAQCLMPLQVIVSLAEYLYHVTVGVVAERPGTHILKHLHK